MDFSPESGTVGPEAEWRRLVRKALGDASLAALNVTLDTGGKTLPLHTPSTGAGQARDSGHPGAPPFVRGTSAPAPEPPGWTILQLIDRRDFPEAAESARHGQMDGVHGVWLELAGGVPYGASQLRISELKDLEHVLGAVALDKTPIHFSPSQQTIPVLALLISFAHRRGVGLEQLRGILGLDPLSVMAARHEAPVPSDFALCEAVDTALFMRGERLAMTPFCASGRVWHQAGGSAVEELACALAAAVAYWRALADANVPPDEAASMIAFHLTADPDVFLSLAKFRALRALWARATEVAGLAPQPASASAELSMRTMTTRDPHTNLLRATAAGFAAASGGAHAIVLLPFSAAAGMPDAFSQRMARNTQLILGEEAGIGRVIDAAGGAWYVETLTHDLAAQAWAQFQEIEAAGGLLAALKSGTIAQKLENIRNRRAGEIARRERAITGVSTYPQLDEAPAPIVRVEASQADGKESVAVDELPPPAHGERMSALVAAAQRGASVDALTKAMCTPFDALPPLPDPGVRDAAGFEALRAASDEALSIVGVRPSVFLANIGSLSAFTGRATWAKNFFEAGGIQAIDSPGFENVDTLVDAFRDSGAVIACLCGHDEDYAVLAELAEKLRTCGAAAVYIVGTPDTSQALGEADARAVQDVLFEGCDVLGILRQAHVLLKVDEVISAARRRAEEEAQTGWAQTDGWS